MIPTGFVCVTVRWSLFDEGDGNIFTFGAVAESEAALFVCSISAQN